MMKERNQYSKEFKEEAARIHRRASKPSLGLKHHLRLGE
jgi:hypothetical protein